ncbi:MAG TPA: hypothetical protein DIU39_07430 [Flavobacteriales bacterium]|nr:hypothetical protein [Flavobacteriales bacterium]|tara:strand:+ start:112029 stop:113084 length:1056 start_codon:yes stop_codon:yes gene_type:complete
MKKITIIASLSLLIFGNSVKAQDIHFSQFYEAPVLNNPANAGVFNGDFRAILNYRSQWGSIGNPFKTYAFSADGNFMKKKWRNAFLGYGLFAYKDVAGETQFSTTNINGTLSATLNIDRDNSFSLGIQGGYVARSINYGNLRWDNQFNGFYYDENLPSGEVINLGNYNFVDASAGLLWVYGKEAGTITSNDQFSARAGLALYHINRPKQLLDNGDLDKLYSRFSMFGEVHYGIQNTRYAFRPKFMYYQQGKQKELNIGMFFRYMIKEESKYTGIFKNVSASLGAFYRTGDAFIPALLLEVANYSIGFSYDMNVSKLSNATNGNGGFEISLRYITPNPYTYGRGSNSKSRFN